MVKKFETETEEKKEMEQEETDESLVQKWTDRMQQSKDERTRWEAWVATTMGFAAGQQRIWWDDDGLMHVKEVEKNEIWRTVNLFPSSLGIIASRLTADEPRWNPKAGQLENVTRDEILAADAALQNVYEESAIDDFSVRDVMKLTIRNAYLQGGGLVYMPWDDELKMPVIQSLSLWDTYTDPTSQYLGKKKWLCFSVPKSVEWIKECEAFDEAKRKAVTADNHLAESGLQELHLRRLMGRTQTSAQTVLCRYCFEVDEDEEKLNYYVIAGGQVLQKDVLDHKNLAEIFDIYRPVITDRFYARPPCADWIDIQKSINKVYSSIESYIDIHLQGKWRISDDTIEIPVGGTHGQIIEAAQGEIESIPMQPLPTTHFAHLRQAIVQWEQITGVHSESMGRQSGGAESGKAIATLQAFDEQNSADAVDNFKTFMKRVGRKLLAQMSANWDEVQTLYRYDKKTNQQVAMKVIGEDYKDVKRTTKGKKDVTKLRPFQRLDVELVVGPWFSQFRKQEIVKELLTSGWTPGANPVIDRVVMDAYDIGAIREVVDELKTMENPRLLIAMGNAALIADGQKVPVNDDDPHEVYANFYEQKAQEALQNGDQRAAQLLNSAAQEHRTVMDGGGQGAGSSESLLDTMGQ